MKWKLMGLAVVLAGVAMAASAAAPVQLYSAVVSPQEKNKAVARRVFEEIFNQGKFQVADEIYAGDFVNHGEHRDADLKEDQAAVQWEKQALPDLKMSVDLMVAENDLVTVVWRAAGTNTRAIGWLPATGVRVELRGITVWRIADGKIREEWTSFDMLGVAHRIVVQLKWQIGGILCGAFLLLWVAARLIGRLIRRTANPGVPPGRARSAGD